IVTGAGGDISGNGINGIHAITAAGGTIIIDAAGDIGTGANGVSSTGILAQQFTAADTSITVRGDIFADATGVQVSAAGGHVGVTTTAGSNIIADTFFGIVIAGDATADVVADGNVAGSLAGIQVTATDDISVKYSGTIRATAPTGVGIRAISTAGGDISIDGSGPSGGAILAGQVGIFAQTNGAGKIDVGFFGNGTGDILNVQAAGIETHAVDGGTTILSRGFIE